MELSNLQVVILQISCSRKPSINRRHLPYCILLPSPFSQTHPELEMGKLTILLDSGFLVAVDRYASCRPETTVGYGSSRLIFPTLSLCACVKSTRSGKAHNQEKSKIPWTLFLLEVHRRKRSTLVKIKGKRRAEHESTTPIPQHLLGFVSCCLCCRCSFCPIPTTEHIACFRFSGANSGFSASDLEIAQRSLRLIIS